jgi:hypothetical protein
MGLALYKVTSKEISPTYKFVSWTELTSRNLSEEFLSSSPICTNFWDYGTTIIECYKDQYTIEVKSYRQYLYRTNPLNVLVNDHDKLFKTLTLNDCMFGMTKTQYELFINSLSNGF